MAVNTWAVTRRVIFALTFLLIIWLAIIAFGVVRHRSSLTAVAKCKDTNPLCGGQGEELSLTITSPEGTEFVFKNEFILEGVIKTPHNSPLQHMTLHIRGRYPSTVPFKDIELLNGPLGQVIGPAGGHFRKVVSNQLFCEAVQRMDFPPFANLIYVTAENLSQIIQPEDPKQLPGPGGTVVNSMCGFVRPDHQNSQ